MSANKDLPIIPFTSAKAWGQWLTKHHAKSNGIWLRFYKKDSGIKTVSQDDAVIEALCWGWIDGQADKYDEKSWLQRFTPRRKGSVWSMRNVDRAERLIKEKRMTPAGMREVEAAKADGRWDNAYASPSKMEVPEDFLKELSKNKKAAAFFKTLNKANTYAIAWRLATAKKTETRGRRMKKLLEMMENGEKFH